MVIAETCHLLTWRLSVEAELRFLEKAERKMFDIREAQPTQLGRVRALIRRYINLPMDLADASLVLLAEELGHGNILTTDRRDFLAYRWRNDQPFNNLLFPA